MKISDLHLGFIGFGHMAQILFRAMDQSRVIDRSKVLFLQRDPKKMRQNQEKFQVTSTSLKHLIEASDLLILSVRPQQAEMVLEEIQKHPLSSSKMFVSILAGVRFEMYRKYLKTPVTRLMPNIASEVGCGMSLLSFQEGVEKEQKDLLKLLFSCMGRVAFVPEELMDISCAIAGSGPGFVFQLIQSMAKAGEKEGIDASLALEMAAQTFLGAAKLVLKTGDVDSLLHHIATPKGTTEAGLQKMREMDIGGQFEKVILASSVRSKELSQSS